MGGCRGLPCRVADDDGPAIDAAECRPPRVSNSVSSRRRVKLRFVAQMPLRQCFVRTRRVCSACPNLYRSVNNLIARHCSGAPSGLAPALDIVAVDCFDRLLKIAIHCQCLHIRVAYGTQRAKMQRPIPPYKNRHGDLHRQKRARSSTRSLPGCPSSTPTTARS